jgi:hypothetical protein
MERRESDTPNSWDEAAVTGALINPFYAITIDEGLFGEHTPLVSRGQWVKANAKLIDELGAEEYLRRLLKVLEGDYPRQPD